MDSFNKTKNERGALAIEAVIALTFFLVSLIALLFFTLMLRAQSSIQYALGQTAKEISGYYYLLDKAGITALTTMPDSEKVKDIDKTIGYVIDFSDDAVDMTKGLNETDLFKDNNLSLKDLQKLADSKDFDNLAKSAQNIGKSLENLGKDPKSQITGILSVFAKTMANKVMSTAVAPYVCRAIMPRYLAGDTKSSNEMLEEIGISGGVQAIDFSQTRLLTDGRSIVIVAMYKMDASKFTFGIVNHEFTVKQVAATAAWIRPDGKNTKSLDSLEIKSKQNSSSGNSAPASIGSEPSSSGTEPSSSGTEPSSSGTAPATSSGE